MQNILKKKKIIVTLGLLLCILIIAGIYYLKNSPHSFDEALEVPFYHDLIISQIHLQGVSSDFSIKDGKIFRDGVEIDEKENKEQYQRVLRLALFYQWTREKPLLFSPNLEIEKFNNALDNLKIGNERSKEMAKINQNMFPVDFLKDFSDTSIVYRNFAGNISEENAEKLIDSMQKTAKSYISNAQDVKNIFKIAIEKNYGNRNIIFLGGATASTFPIMINDLELIIENGNAIEAEIQKISSCLKQSAAFCKRPLLSFAEPAENPNENLSTPDFLDKKEFENDSAELHGPYVVHSSCWKGRDVAQFIYASRKCEEYCTEWSYLADDVFFVKLGNKPIEKKLKEKGIMLSPQSPTVPYGCTDLEYKANLQTIDDAYNFFDHNSYFAEIKKGNTSLSNIDIEVMDRGTALENKFFNVKYPSDTALNELAVYYGFAYGFFSKNENISLQERENLLNRHILFSEKMSSFDLIMNRSSFHLENYENGISDLAELVKKPEYLFAARSNYSIFFLNFSSLAWIKEQKPKYVVDDFKLESVHYPDGSNIAPIINYQKAREIFGDEKLDSWKDLIKEIDLENELHHPKK